MLKSCILLIYQLMDSARLKVYHKPLHTKVTNLMFLLKPQQSTEKREKKVLFNCFFLKSRNIPCHKSKISIILFFDLPNVFTSSLNCFLGVQSLLIIELCHSYTFSCSVTKLCPTLCDPRITACHASLSPGISSDSCPCSQ